MELNKHIKLGFIALAILLAVFLGVIIKRHTYTPDVKIEHIPPRATPAFMMPDDYFFRQDSDDWGTDKIGTTTDTLTGYGCTIASVSIAASNLLKTEITPGDLNRELGAVGGFTDRGWLIWQKLESATDGQLRTEYYSQPSHAAIKQCMQDDGYPIVKIKLRGIIVHWVVVVGKSDAGYLVRDPLVGQAGDEPILLSSRSDYIYAARCISLSQG